MKIKFNVLRRTFSLIFLFLIIIAPINFKAEIYYPLLAGESNLLIDADTNVVYLHDNIEQKTNIKSLSKMMTAYLVFSYLKKEKIDVETEIVINARAATIKGQNPEIQGVYFNIGQKVKIQKLLELMLVYSDEGATIQLAEMTAKTEDKFVEEMNSQVKTLNLKNTKFHNSTGLDKKYYNEIKLSNNGENTSTSRDLAILGAKLVNDYPEILEYTSNPNVEYMGYQYNNINQLLSEGLYKYSGTKGIQGSSLNESKTSFVGYYEHDSHNYVSIILNVNSKDETNAYEQTTKMYEWIENQEINFVQLLETDNKYITETIRNSGVYNLDLYPKENIFSLKNNKLSMNLIRKEYNPEYFTKTGKLLKRLPQGKTVETLIFVISDSTINFNTIELDKEFRIDLIAKNDIKKQNFFGKLVNGTYNGIVNFYNKIFN